MNMLKKAIWALSLCPVDAGSTLLPPLRVLGNGKLSKDSDRLAPGGHNRPRRTQEHLGFALPVNFACCGTDSIG